MFGDNRIEWGVCNALAEIYFVANCKYFKQLNAGISNNYDKEVFNFLLDNARRVVPIICVDKQKKLITQDIATQAYKNLYACFEMGMFLQGRKFATDGVNALIKNVVGEKIFFVIEKEFGALANSVVVAISELEPESIIKIASAKQELQTVLINNGLIKI